MILTIASPNGPKSSYTLAELRQMARRQVKACNDKAKLLGFTVQVNEDNGRVQLIASYEYAPNAQTFTTMAL